MWIAGTHVEGYEEVFCQPGWRAEFEKTQLPAYGYIAAAAVIKMLTDSVKVGDVTIQPKDLWWRGRP